MWTATFTFLPKSYVQPSLQWVNPSCNDKSFPAIPNKPGSIGPKWFELRKCHNLGLTTLQLAIWELQYVLQYNVMTIFFGNKQIILVFYFFFQQPQHKKTIGVTTATTMAAASGNAPLAPHMRSSAQRRRVQWMGNNPQVCGCILGGGLRVFMALKVLPVMLHWHKIGVF